MKGSFCMLDRIRMNVGCFWYIRTLAVFVIAFAVLAACTNTAGPEKAGDQVKSGDTVKIGILHSLSGTMAISETSLRDGVLMAVDEINAKGGVLGKQIEAVV